MLTKFSFCIFWTMFHSSSIGSWSESSLGLRTGVANVLQEICLIWSGTWLASLPGPIPGSHPGILPAGQQRLGTLLVKTCLKQAEQGRTDFSLRSYCSMETSP